MADQHNPEIPALGNAIADDVVDIKENLEFHKDCFEAICEGWDNATAANLKVNTLADDTVVTDYILDDAVTNDKIVDDAVDTEQLADGAVDVNRLASNAVETAKIKDANITQAKLKTSTGSVSSTGGSGENKTLPGGTYGFYPQIKVSASGTFICHLGSNITNTSYATNIWIYSTSHTGYAQQRYVTSSGEVHWIFILRNKLTNQITSVWQAPDHPCFGNGGKPQLAPHPFPGYDNTKYEIIVINPSKEKVLEMKRKTIIESETEPDKDLIEVILKDCDLDETTEPAWPSIPVTVGLPPEWEETPIGGSIEPVKKVIPKPSYVKTAALKIKKVTPKEM